MDSYLQVIRTYLWRPRFWILAVTYLLAVWFWFWYYDWNTPEQRQGQAVTSAIYLCLAGCFLALHVRRQFSHAGARLIPGYATPHLVVAGVLSNSLWLGVPAALVWRDYWPAGTLAFHACAAILMAIVASWPRGLLLIMAIPALAIWANRPLPPGQQPLLQELAAGRQPVLAATLIALAFIAQAVAIVMLLRLPRSGITTNDEFTLEGPTTAAGENRLNDWLLGTREAAARRLMDARFLPSIQRWRVPVAISPALLLLPAVVVAGGGLFGWWYEEATGWLIFSLILTCAILPLVPLAPWQSRHRAMSQEILRPVTRKRYFRELMTAMALDVVVWMLAASLLIAVALATQWKTFHEPEAVQVYCSILGISLALLWSMATFVYGVGLATLRWRLWLPLVAMTALSWFFGSWGGMVYLGESIYGSTRQLDRHLPAILSGYCIVTAWVGLFLAANTYRHWIRNDVA